MACDALPFGVIGSGCVDVLKGVIVSVKSLLQTSVYASRAASEVIRSDGIGGLAAFLQDLRQGIAERAALKRWSRDMEYSGDSSLSDAGIYPRFCQWAAEDEAVFSGFRASQIYRGVLEHVSEEQGREYLVEIDRMGMHVDEFRTLVGSDWVGSPRCCTYGSLGPVSPTLLRYVKVAAELRHLFGSLAGMSIAEVGIGYGGQSRVLTSLWPIRNYYLYDIPEVLALADRFLHAIEAVSPNLVPCDGRDPAPGNFDLLISNYAFSELRRDLQEVYLERVVKSSRRGYVTYNHITPPEWGSLSAEQFASQIPGAQIIDEVPLTHPGNVIVVWGGADP